MWGVWTSATDATPPAMDTAKIMDEDRSINVFVYSFPSSYLQCYRNRIYLKADLLLSNVISFIRVEYV